VIDAHKPQKKTALDLIFLDFVSLLLCRLVRPCGQKGADAGARGPEVKTDDGALS
jgi:hypothetical protein